MEIIYNNKKYYAKYDERTHSIGVENPDTDILLAINNDGVQRGLLIDYFCNRNVNLNEIIKNGKLN